MKNIIKKESAVCDNDDYIQALKQKCKSKCIKHPLTIIDFKVIYFLWNDNTVCREKIL